VFLDGSATVTSAPSAQATDLGQGTLILTGTFMMKNALMCVKTTGNGNGTHCDTAAGAWDPNVGALVIIADGDGGYDTVQGQSNNVSAGQATNIKTPDSQGGRTANRDISVDPPSRMRGPMISVSHAGDAAQSNLLPFPPILFAPS